MLERRRSADGEGRAGDQLEMLEERPSRPYLIRAEPRPSHVLHDASKITGLDAKYECVHIGFPSLLQYCTLYPLILSSCDHLNAVSQSYLTLRLEGIVQLLPDHLDARDIADQTILAPDAS